MAAAAALKNILPHLKTPPPGIADSARQLYREWQAGNLKNLIAFTNDTDQTVRTLAIYALGDMRHKDATEALIQLFYDPTLSSDIRWAVTDALTRLSPTTLMFRVITPLVDEDMAGIAQTPAEIWTNREEWYANIAYLIGALEEQDPLLIQFLDRCLGEISGYWVTVHAIQSIGALYLRQHKTTLENIALGDFSALRLGKRLSQDERSHLKIKAVEALANVGDQESLQRLRADRPEWDPEWEQVLFRTSEEIYWRLNLGMY
jgi:HEAT repeat protein